MKISRGQKQVIISSVFSALLAAIATYLIIKNSQPSLDEISSEKQSLKLEIHSIQDKIDRIESSISKIEENEKDTIKYYYTVDRSITMLDRPEQSSLFSINTKELLQKERQGYFDDNQP